MDVRKKFSAAARRPREAFFRPPKDLTVPGTFSPVIGNW
ncbi:hypothetical protein D3OALGA1CA_1902 [Olavius algarvensis associated proteobacterium Delta 3]|nr:hypothetical protein D3OALGA1CA_1902 [Olavius algarvensis associated proteobacterium Delta 3]CAB5134841.1 hypothetical protein D3OALGB2SA_3863 [Olavius algarvensis associated proteobacterium Delta 3]